jgi:hypothetical protein
MLLRTSVAVFAAAISLGLWSGVSNTVLAHDMYSNPVIGMDISVVMDRTVGQCRQ